VPKIKTIRVPARVVESLSLHAIDIDSGKLTPELQDLLKLNPGELEKAQAVFDDYLAAYLKAEGKQATVASRGERRKHDHPDLERIITVRIDPLGDQLAEDNATLQTGMTNLLGPSRGFAAASLIRRQFGNSG
jgi:hypothetical protein